MVLFDRKKALSQIMGPSPNDKPAKAEDPAHTISKEAIAAVHAHDHEGFANATKALFMHFQSDSDQDGDMHDSDTGQEIE